MNAKQNTALGKTELTGNIATTVSGSTKTQILVDPAPINIAVQTTTDWPTVYANAAIGASTIFTAILVAWISSANQRAQSRAVVAGFRRDWQTQFRNACIEFNVMTTKILKDKIYLGPEFKEEAPRLGDYHDRLIEFAKSKIAIEFLLDPVKMRATNENKSNHVRNVMHALKAVDEILTNFPRGGTHSLDLNVKLGPAVLHFNECAKAVLEEAWLDIKDDAYGANELNIYRYLRRKLLGKILGTHRVPAAKVKASEEPK